MPKIVTTSAFEVATPEGLVQVARGESDVPQEVAEHWFTVAHLVGTPKGRLPLVEGPDGLMIEADEAGQRVTAVPDLSDPNLPMMRQEGPIAWSQGNPRAVEAAKQAAEAAGTTATEAVGASQQAASGAAPRVDDTGAPRTAAQRDAAERLEVVRLASAKPPSK